MWANVNWIARCGGPEGATGSIPAHRRTLSSVAADVEPCGQTEGGWLSPGSTGRQSKSTDSRQEVDSRQQVDSNSSIALSTTVNHCQPKVDSHNACPLSTTVNHGRQWSTGSTGAAGSTGSTGRQREWVDSGKHINITDLHV